jgi:cytoskeletal protein CcmA (bactofilin family)
MTTGKSGWIRSDSMTSTFQPESKTLTASDTSLTASSPYSAGREAVIPKGMVFRGDITGSGSLRIEGDFQGSIRIDDNRVTVGRDANVEATIVASDVLVMGQLRGNISATNRAEIRSEANFIGDLVAPRVIIEMGASLQSDIDTRKSEPSRDLKNLRRTPVHANMERNQRIRSQALLPTGVTAAKETGFERERLTAS